MEQALSPSMLEVEEGQGGGGGLRDLPARAIVTVQ